MLSRGRSFVPELCTCIRARLATVVEVGSLSRPAAWHDRGVRILHLVGRSHPRGAELVALELGAELDRIGHQNSLAALFAAAEGDNIDELPPLCPDHVGERRLAPRHVLALRRLISDGRVDVVLAHGADAAQAAAISVIGSRRPALIWQRIMRFAPEVFAPPRRQIWSAVIRRMDGLVALTDQERHEVERLGYQGPVWTIPNFRQPNRFLGTDRAIERRRLHDDLGLADDVPLIGFVGRLTAQKRPLAALDVLELVRSSGTAAHLVVAGDGPLRDALEKDVKERHLDEHVSVLGHRKDVERIFGGVDVVAIVSDAEGMPGVAIEAAMAGCPLVTFPVGGVREVVLQGQTGIVLDEHSEAKAAAEIASLLRDASRRTAMSEAARLHSIRFSVEGIARRYDEVLTAVSTARANSVLRDQTSPGSEGR